MNKPNVTKMFNNAKRTLSKHSPEILTGVGIAGMATSIVLAVKVTPKALRLIEDARYEKGEELTPIEKTKACWKCYVPVVLTATTSAACLIGANSVNVKRNAALATAYKLSETAFTEYREKVIETIGEKKHQAVKDKIAKEKIEKNQPNNTGIIVTGGGNTRFLDGTFGRYFTSDIEKIKKATNDLNRRMLSEMYISLNEFYSEIGLDEVEVGDDMGWNLDEGFIELDWSSQICEDGTPCIVMSYRVAPRYEFDKLM